MFRSGDVHSVILEVEKTRALVILEMGECASVILKVEVGHVRCLKRGEFMFARGGMPRCQSEVSCPVKHRERSTSLFLVRGVMNFRFQPENPRI